MKIGTRMSLFISAVVIISLTFAGTFIILNATKSLRSIVNDSASYQVLTASNLISNEINSYYKALEEFTYEYDFNNVDWETLAPKLQKRAELYGYSDIGYVSLNGDIHAINQPVRNISDNPLFKRALKGERVISSPKYFEEKDTYYADILVPVKDYSDRVTNIMFAVINYDLINDRVIDLKYGNAGAGFMIDKEGFTIAHTNKELIKDKDNDFESVKSNPELQELVDLEKKMVAGETGAGMYNYHGVKKMLAFAPVKGTDWSLAIAVEHAVIMKDFTVLKQLVIIVFGVVLLLIIASTLIISRKFITRPVGQLVEISKQVAVGETDIDLNVNASGEIKDLVDGYSLIINNLQAGADTCHKLAGGNFSINVEPHSEKDILGVSLKEITTTLQALKTELDVITENSLNGNLSYRGDVDKFENGYKDIVQGFNNSLDAIIDPINTAINVAEAISRGDDDIKYITNNYKGDYKDFTDSLNTIIETLKITFQEFIGLGTAIKEGNLTHRADTSKFAGGFVTMIDDINEAIDDLVSIVNMEAKYIHMIGVGQIPEKISDDAPMKGDLIAIKESINGCIDNLDALVIGTDVLKKLAQNDYTVKMTGEYQGIYNEIAESIGMLTDTFTRLIRILDNVSKGNLSDIEELYKIGKRCDNDRLIPTVIKMMENINALVIEANNLSRSAVHGDLSARGNPDKFEGEYVKVVDGINKTLDAIVEPVSRANDILKEISQGNLHVEMTGDYEGTYLEIKNVINDTAKTLDTYVKEISTVLNGLSNKDLNYTITTEYRGDFIEIKDSINNIVYTLNQIIYEITQAANQVASGSLQVSDSSQSLSQGSMEQASSIQQLTASILEMTDQTKQNAENARDASLVANRTKETAIKGNEQMQLMLNSMKDINESSTNISKIIKVIDEIAFQTNILALNAAVEAARAGQYGKGFAVVAEEVRNLASRSAEAANDTTALIESSIEKVTEGTNIANQTAEALEEIVSGIEKAAALSDEIDQASYEQANNFVQINLGIEEVSKVVQANSATSEESAAISEELSSQAEFLNNMIEQFKLNVSLLTGNTQTVSGITTTVPVLEEHDKKEENNDSIISSGESKYEGF